MSRLAVCGLGRCGTTAVMTMLAAGGVPVSGAAPGFEIEGQPDPGTAYKLLDPHRPVQEMPRAVPAVVLWLARDLDHQATSALRLLQHGGHRAATTRGQRREMAAMLERDTRTAKGALRRWCHGDTRFRHWTFEELVGHPEGSARMLARVVEEAGLGELDQAAAAGAVHDRDALPREVPWEVAQGFWGARP